MSKKQPLSEPLQALSQWQPSKTSFLDGEEKLLNDARRAGVILTDSWDIDFDDSCQKGCGCYHCDTNSDGQRRSYRDFAYQIRKEAMTRVCRRKSCRKTGCTCDDT